MLQAVINKDSLMRRYLCGKLHGGWSQLLFALHQSRQNIAITGTKKNYNGVATRW